MLNICYTLLGKNNLNFYIKHKSNHSSYLFFLTHSYNKQYFFNLYYYYKNLIFNNYFEINFFLNINFDFIFKIIIDPINKLHLNAINNRFIIFLCFFF